MVQAVGRPKRDGLRWIVWIGHGADGASVHDLLANGRWQEIAVGGAGKRTVRQMGAAAGGIVHAYYDLSREKMLNAEIPLIDFGIACLSGVEAVVIRQSPKR